MLRRGCSRRRWKHHGTGIGVLDDGGSIPIVEQPGVVVAAQPAMNGFDDLHRSLGEHTIMKIAVFNIELASALLLSHVAPKWQTSHWEPANSMR